MLREFDVPVYGSRLTMGLVQVKIDEAGLEKKARLQTVSARESVTFGVFNA